MKHTFEVEQAPTEHYIDLLITMVTKDGSVVDRIKIDHKWARSLGRDTHVTIWTKKPNEDAKG